MDILNFDRARIIPGAELLNLRGGVILGKVYCKKWAEPEDIILGEVYVEDCSEALNTCLSEYPETDYSTC